MNAEPRVKPNPLGIAAYSTEQIRRDLLAHGWMPQDWSQKYYRQPGFKNGEEIAHGLSDRTLLVVKHIPTVLLTVLDELDKLRAEIEVLKK